MRAYQGRAEVPVSESWQTNVMGEIRKIGPQFVPVSPASDFRVAVWRLAPVTCLLLILLLTGATWLDPSADALIAEGFLKDPVDVVFGDILRG